MTLCTTLVPILPTSNDYFSDRLLGTVTALITVKVGDNLVESVITKRSAAEMGLKKGDNVLAVIKATEVMIQKD